MRVRFQIGAAADLEEIANVIRLDNPRAASRLVQRIQSRFQLMADTGFHEIGRRGRVRGTRELVE